MASVIIASELNKIKTGLESGDTNVKDELGSFLQKYGSNDEEIRENSDEFADPDLYELVLDKGPDVLPPDLFLRLMMVYSMLEKESMLPLFNEYGGVAEILTTMDASVKNPAIIALGARVLGSLAERDGALRTEIGAGDGMSLLVDALDFHKAQPVAAITLLTALTNVIFDHTSNKGSFLAHNGLKVLLDLVTLNTQQPKLEQDGKTAVCKEILMQMREHKLNPGIMASGFWAMLNLMQGSAANKLGFVNNRGLDVVVDAINKWYKDETVMEPACLCVQQAAKMVKNRRAVSDKGIIGLLVLRNHHSSESANVLLPAINALYRLSFDDENRAMVGLDGGIPELLWPLNNNIPSPRLHRVIGRAILKLCRDDSNKELIREDGGVGAIVTSMNFYRDNPSVTQLMVRAMNFLFAKDGEEPASTSPIKAKNSPRRNSSNSSDSDDDTNGSGSDSVSDSDSGSDEDSSSGSDQSKSPEINWTPDMLLGGNSPPQAQYQPHPIAVKSPRVPPIQVEEIETVHGVTKPINIKSPRSPRGGASPVSGSPRSPPISISASPRMSPRGSTSPRSHSPISSSPRERPTVKASLEDIERMTDMLMEMGGADQKATEAEVAAAAKKAADEAELKRMEEEEAEEARKMFAYAAAEANAKAEAEEAAKAAVEQAAANAKAEEAKEAAEHAKRKEEEAKLAAEKAEADAKAAAEAAEAKKLADEAAALKKQQEEAALQKQQEQEAAAAAAALKKQHEEEEARKKKEDEDAAAAALKKRQEEAAALKKQEEAAAQKKQDEEAAALRKKQEEAAAAAALLKKQEEEAAALLQKQKQEEEEAAALLQKQKQEEEAARKLREAEALRDAEFKREQELIDAKKRADEEEEAKIRAAEAIARNATDEIRNNSAQFKQAEEQLLQPTGSNQKVQKRKSLDSSQKPIIGTGSGDNGRIGGGANADSEGARTKFFIAIAALGLVVIGIVVIVKKFWA